jgi:WD40 repeat protein/Tfp pilus assembly protein PilF
MSPCPFPERFRQLIANELDAAEAAALEDHVEACAPCQQALARLVDAPGIGARPGVANDGTTEPRPADGAADPAEAFLRQLAEHPPASVRLPDGAPIADTFPSVTVGIDAPRGAAAGWPVIAGFEIRGELGRGGMGVVYQARQVALNRLVALKMILAGNHADAEKQRRFRVEAEAIARLRHPNFVQVHDHGHSDGHAYLALEFVEGGTLAQKAAGVPQPPAQAAQLVETLAAAIQHAHQHGLVHRDLKPTNVLFTADGVAKITDFGLAKRLEEATAETASGALLGTPSYMAPEQAAGHGKAVGPAVDVYALGVILYELLTGRPPFQGDSVLEVLRQVQEEEPLPPARLRPGLPRDLETICLKCLQKEPGQRYATAVALAEDLRRFRAGEPIAARPVGTLERAWRWSRRNPRWAAMLATMAGLLVVIAVGATALSLWALQAEAQTKEKLFESRLAEAIAWSRSRRPGQRFESLRLLDEAGELARTLKLGPERLHDLRNATIAALAMSDIYPDRTWDGFPPGSVHVHFDGRLEVYARTDREGNCSIRRVDGDVELHRLPGQGPAGEGHWPLLSRDARFVAVHHEDCHARLWKLDGTQPEVVLTEKEVFWMDFRPDSRQVGFSHLDGAITVHELTTGQRVHWPPDGLTREVVIALHPTEPLVAAASYYAKDVQVRDVRTGKVVKSLEMPHSGSHVAWHPAGHTLAASDGDGEGHALYLFDLATFRSRTIGPTGGGARVFFSPDGNHLAVHDWSRSVRLFEVATGQLRFRIPYTQPIDLLCFHQDGRRLAGFTERGRLGIWQVGDSREYRTLVRQPPHEGAFYGQASISADGQLLAVATTGGVGFWDLETGRFLDLLPLHSRDLSHFVLFEPGPDGALLTGDFSGTYRWPLRGDGSRPGRRRIGPPQPLALPAGLNTWQSSDGRVLVSCFRPVGDWQPWAGAWILRADRPDSPLHLGAGGNFGHVTVSPDGRWIVTGDHDGERAAQLWDAQTGRLERRLLDRAGLPTFSPDGRWLAIGGEDGQLFTVGTWTPVRKLSRWVHTFAPDSKTLVEGTNEPHVFRLVEVATGREFARLEDPDLNDAVYVLFTPDGSQLIIVNRQTGIHVWDLRRLRAGLAERGRDWEAPRYEPAAAAARPLQIDLDRGDYERLSEEQRVQNFDRAVAAAPDIAVRWYLRGKFHEEAGRFDKAQADLRQAVARAPKKARFCNDLARLDATGPEALRDAQESVAMAERAVELTPGQWDYQTTLGIAYYRAGRYKDSVATLERSLRGRAGVKDAADLYFLAMAYHRLGESGKAKEFFDRARTSHERQAAHLEKVEAAEWQQFATEATGLLHRAVGEIRSPDGNPKGIR